MTLSNDQWQEAIVQLANSGLSAAAMSATGGTVPGSADYMGGKDGSGNLQGLLVESASNPNLRTAIYNGANELAVDASGRLTILSIANALPAGTNVIGGAYLVDSGGTNKAAVDASGRQSVKAAANDITDLATVAGAIANNRAQIGRLTSALYSLASTTTSGTTQNSGDLTVGPYTEIGIDINTTAQAGTSPTIQYFYERKGADGIYYVLWQSNVLTAATNTLSTSIGAGMAYNQSLGSTGRLRWVIGGSATPTFTHSLNIYAK